MKGYRLHDERIARFGGAGSMRTVKYELVDAEAYRTPAPQSPVRDRIVEAVFGDYRKLYGNLNLSDFLTGEVSPSVLDFWLLSLSLGVFYGESIDKLGAAFGAYRGKETALDQRFNSLPADLQMILDPYLWGNFLVANQRGLADKPPQKRVQIIFNLMRAEYKKRPESVARLQTIAEKYAEGCVDAADSGRFKAELFGVEPLTARSEGMQYVLTWTVNPQWPEISWQPGEDPTSLIEETIMRHSKVYGNNQQAAVVAMGIGNNGGYLNNIFGTARKYLLDGKPAALASQMAAAHDFSEQERVAVASRIERLAAYAHKLGEPTVTTTWSDYRSDFNGTLESWFSHRKGKQDDAHQQLDELDNALQELLQLLAESSAEREPVYALCNELMQVVDEARADGHVTHEESQSIRLLQGEVRGALNEWQQRSAVGDKRLGKHGAVGKVLGKKVQSTPLFFGVSQRSKYEKLVYAKRDTLAQLRLLRDIWQWTLPLVSPDVLVIDRQVAALAASAQRCEHTLIRGAYDRMQHTLNADFSKQRDRDRFYISGYERQRGLRKLPFTAVSVAELVRMADIVSLASELSEAIATPNFLRDFVQLSKTLLAAALSATNQDSIYRLTEPSQLTERQQKLIERKAAGDGVGQDTLRLLQVYIHSELSGFAALLSRRLVIERSSVQAVNGGQVRLAYEIAHKNTDTYRRYYVNHVVLDDSVSQSAILDRPLMQAHKPYNFVAADFVEKNQPEGNFLAIKSSRYQVQFLEWLLGYLPRRKTALAGGGAFTIAERSVELDWSGDTLKVLSGDDKRLFLAQPFTLLAKDAPKTVEKEDKPRFVGVDIGEYGLAVNVIECEAENVKSLYVGFITDPQHRLLASRVKRLRENQVRATFNQPDTRVARLRESLTGTYRNRLESLALKHNAYLSFEWEVSGFEAGGARIAKVYDSVKRADIKKSDNQVQNIQAWGKLSKDQHKWAMEATAAGTSQTCSRCKRWASLLINDSQVYALQAYGHGLKTADLDDGRQIMCISDAASLKGTDLKKAIYAAMRPPVGGVSLGLTEYKLGDEEAAWWKEARGNMALYVCPFTDCHHLSDADLQAALNIAVRGYAKWQTGGKMSKAEDLVRFSQELVYEPVQINLELNRNGVVARVR